MSGIVGILNLDGSPADPQLLERLTGSMSFRGPDRLATWNDGPVGLGHALLRTTDEAATERQPCTIDGRSWITADARIDGRDELIQKLAALGERVRTPITDPELILHSYRAFGHGFLEHLIGDFAFAIWDSLDRKMVCARDQMGVKPFYFARVQSVFVFSNTLNTIRLHPLVSDELEEVAIGDFLLCGMNYDVSRTSFAAVSQLPPAHTVTCQDQRFETRRYWSLPIPSEVHYRDKREYGERFFELLQRATLDRLRAPRVSISLSGGLDSSSVAFFAQQGLQKSQVTDPLLGMTVAYDNMIPDQERYFTRIVAEHLGIKVQFMRGEDFRLFLDMDGSPMPPSPEPDSNPLAALFYAQIKIAAGHSRVLLTGHDGDAVLSPSRGEYIRALIRGKRVLRLAKDASWFIKTQHRLPALGLRARLRSSAKNTWEYPGYPSWLNREFEHRGRLRERWQEIYQTTVPEEYRLRGASYRLLTSPLWAASHVASDPGVTRYNVEFRHPLLDTRLVEFCLSLPQVPWCVGKFLIRDAMRRHLPTRIIRRRKAPLAGNVVLPRLSRDSKPIARAFLPPHPALRTYVDPAWMQRFEVPDSSILKWTDFNPIVLGHWLKHG